MQALMTTASGGGVLTPSSVGSHVIHLASRLIIGIRLHGTLAAPNPRTPSHLKPRPYLRYFADTLRRVRCDVTLFAPSASCAMTAQLAQLGAHHLVCPFRVLHDPTSGPGPSRGAARANFQNCLADIAAERHTSPTRILFVDAEINCRFSPAQTLVLETYEPQRTRQMRQNSGKGEMEGEGRKLGSAVARQVRQHTAGIEAEHAFMERRGKAHIHERPFSTDTATETWNPNTNRPREGEWDTVGVQTDSVREAALAINRDDFTLVALAGMIVELAASEVSVAEYLRVEPLVEKLTVPFHGKVYYLPMENCDDMEKWDWDAVEVREAMRTETDTAAEAVPDVEEREEHRDLFK